MKVTFTALSAFLALINQSLANLDVVALFANGNTWIQEASATLVVGNVPNPITGDTALWSAIMMDQSDFLQGVTQNSPSSAYCPNIGRSWCNFAYTLIGSTNPTVGAAATASPGSRIRTHYKYNSGSNLWDQSVYINDRLVSTVSTSRGQKGKIFYISIECASGSCGVAPAHSWEKVSITLNQADKSFMHNGNWNYNASGGKMSTSDNGKTWNFTTLSIPNTQAS